MKEKAPQKTHAQRREEIAAQIMAGLIARNPREITDGNLQSYAKQAVIGADFLIKELSQMKDPS